MSSSGSGYLPLDWDTPQRRVFELVCFFGAKVAVFVDTVREQILHQADLDALLLGD